MRSISVGRGFSVFGLVGVCLALSVSIHAETAPTPTFEADILPLFKARCFKCHGEKKRRADLDLRTIEAVLNGGENGRAIVPGASKDSLLFELIVSEEMPPKEPLAADEIALVRRWIDSGARSVTQQDDSAGQVTEHDILPIFQNRCVICHGKRRQEGDLDLRTRESILRGGKSGPAIVLGKPDEGLLIKRVLAGDMPPVDQQLNLSVRPVTKGEIEEIKEWIKNGAPESPSSYYEIVRGPDRLVTEEDRKFWFFQPPRQPPVPTVKHAELVSNPIDAFLLEKLETVELSYSPQADRATLLRRLTFDLTGLPPTPYEVDDFLRDDSPHAYEKAVRRLLASPRYGERWGAYWLDAAGYADSEGKRSADPFRPQSWRYRDYVVRSFNRDQTYDEFLVEQIAGDELVDYKGRKELNQHEIEKIVATGFLRQAPDGTGSGPVNFLPERWEVISDELEVLCTTVMATTITCAKCHSHKYDPIPQRDYYSLASVFRSALDPHDWFPPTRRYLDLTTPEERRAREEVNRQIDQRIAKLEEALEKVAAPLREKLLAERVAAIPESIRDDVRRAVTKPAPERDEVQKYLAKKFAEVFEIKNENLAEKYPEFKEAADKNSQKLQAAAGERLKRPQIRALFELGGEPSPAYILSRGNPLLPGRLVEPKPLAVFSDPAHPYTVEKPWGHDGATGRRLAFAKWLTRPNHPATARVIVNRLWHHHFGRGIVETLGNFGHTGSPPTHPKLLDWLAVEFEARGQSLKEFHRLIVSSTAYRQRSLLTSEHELRDPKNELLSRMRLRRLDAESIRDSILEVAGRLDATRFGPAAPVEIRDDNVVASETERGGRRSIYIQHRRLRMLTMLDTFDRPQFSPNCLSRRQSIVVSQALALMNGEVVRRNARHFAQRVIAAVGDDVERQVDSAYKLALSRAPGDDERELAVRTIQTLRDDWLAELVAAIGTGDAAGTEPENNGHEAALRALTSVCHTLFNSAEFVFID